MKKVKILAGFIVVFLASGIVLAGAASAHDFRAGSDTNVSSGEIIDSTLFIAGSNIDIAGEVYGDVFCAGQTVTISGKVHGDVICAGQTVNISGEVYGDIRLAGQNITVGAIIGGNATLAGQSFTLESKGEIAGDVTVGSEEATFNGVVGRDVAVGGGRVVIANSIGRNISGSLDTLELKLKAEVIGDIEYTSRRELIRAAEATVGGSINRTVPSAVGQPKRGAVFGFGVVWFMFWLLAMLFTSLAIALLFPRILHNSTQRAIPTPWKALLTGFVAGFAAPVLIILLTISVVGVPLAILLGFIWLVIVMLSGPFSGYYLGRVIAPNARNPLFIMLVGASLLTAMYFLPLIGFVTLFLSFWIGSGMILLELLRRTPKPAYEVEATSPSKKKRSKK